MIQIQNSEQEGSSGGGWLWGDTVYLMRNRTIYQSSGQVYSVVLSPLPQEVRLIHTMQDFKGHAGGQNENHPSACMRLSLGTGQSSLCWHKAGRQLNYSVHV